MDLSPFKLDIDELISDFDQAGFRSLSDMKRVWLARKFSYIFDAKPGSGSLALFMQSLYAYCVGHMDTTYSLSHRLGGLYCLYCLYEIQPFKPPFKIYLTLGELRRLKVLVLDAKKEGIKVVSTIVRRMLERNAFLFGFVDINDYSEAERSKINKHKAMLQKMNEKLFPDGSNEHYLHVDMGVELDLGALKSISSEYAEAKALALKEASELVDVQDIKHIAEDDTPSVADQVEKIVEDWNLQKDAFYQQTRSNKHPTRKPAHGDEDHGERTSVQRLANEGELGDESLPHTGFMKLLIAGEEDVQDASQEIQVEEIEQLMETQVNDQEHSSYADDLEKLLYDN